jgi:hypothetical protein
LERIDRSVTEITSGFENAFVELEELESSLRDYNEGLEFDPRGIEELEERINLLETLKRKYGGSLERVLDHRDHAAARLGKIEGRGDELERLRRESAAAREAGVVVATGDTKVVGKGACDKIFITTSGIGEVVYPGLSAGRCRSGDAVIVTVTLPLRPSLEAVMVAAPAVSAVSTPEPDTDALVGSLDVQAMVRPLSAPPALSRVTADSWSVCPICTSADGADTITLATGTGSTDSVAVPVRPSLDAEMVTGPTLSAVTRPVPDTVARDASLDDQVTSRPDNVPPMLSRGEAASCSD